MIIFKDDGETVMIWDGVKDRLMQHKNVFVIKDGEDYGR